MVSVDVWDWAAECTNFPREWSRWHWAHTIESKVEAAYRRGDLFQKRRQLMEAWARFCTRSRSQVDVLLMSAEYSVSASGRDGGEVTAGLYRQFLRASRWA